MNVELDAILCILRWDPIFWCTFSTKEIGIIITMMMREKEISFYNKK